MKPALMTLEGGVTIDRVFMWCDYKRRDYRPGAGPIGSVPYCVRLPPAASQVRVRVVIIYALGGNN